jgi:hypothetical protein
MTVTELTPVVTFDRDGLEVTEFVDSWFDSDDLGYFAEYWENM